jgi:hypothetical protein
LAGIAFESLGWIVWLWLGGNIKGGEYDQSLDLVRFILWGIGVILCTVAPYFSASSFQHKCLRSLLGLLAGVIAAMFGGPLIFLLIAFI